MTTAFLVEVLFRDNTTIQGDITWLDDEKKSFRSALELVHLILAACDEAGPEAEYTLRDWSRDGDAGTQVDGCGVPAHVLFSAQGGGPSAVLSIPPAKVDAAGGHSPL